MSKYKKETGVYLIKNLITGKVYVGSALNIKLKWKRHRILLRKGLHHNQHLQNSWNKHGGENFKFIIWEICDQSVKLDRETYWVNFYNSMDPEKGYNCILPNDPKVIRPRHQKAKNPYPRHICMHKETKEYKFLNVQEIKKELEIKSDKVNKCMAYWRNKKYSIRSYKGWMFISLKDFDPNFDYFSYDALKEYRDNYIPKPKVKYKRKTEEEKIPYADRNIKRQPIVLVKIDTGEKISCNSVMEAVKKYNLIDEKVRKALKNEFGKYKHHGFYFKRLEIK